LITIGAILGGLLAAGGPVTASAAGVRLNWTVTSFEQESQGNFDAREIVLGQTQQGGAPTPFDRILATRLAAHSIDWLSNQIGLLRTDVAVIGVQMGQVRIRSLADVVGLADWANRRPLEQWWLELRPLIEVLSSRLAAQ